MTTETHLTPHECREFSRAAMAMYARGSNAIGHLLSVAAAKRLFRGPAECAQADAARDAYRNWLVFDEPKESQVMTQHTPGPWEVRQADNGKMSIYPIGQAYRVADSYDGIANARLIAAAPELLAALRACLAEYAARAWRNPALTGPASRARAAIAKATGEE